MDGHSYILDNEVKQARDILTARIGNIANSRQRGIQLVLALDPSLKDDEAYTLTVNAKGVNISGKTTRGVLGLDDTRPALARLRHERLR